VGLAAFAFERGADGEIRGQRRGGRLGCLEIGQRGRRLVPGPLATRPALGELPGGLVPSRVRRSEQRHGELVADRRARRLLLGLGGQAPGLRPELGEDVLDAREVGGRLGQLLLGLAPPALVAADPGHLLEQRSTFLGTHRQRLVDHALADEQEGVVGQMGGVQQVDEVAQPDALLVEQVLVLARAEQPPTQLQDLEVDRQQAIPVVDHERDVGHALGRSPLGPRPDDVLGLARAQGLALLAEGPAERVGEVALARAVRADDGADPTPELDVRALGE
jgi:hypothetical protein